MTLEDDLSLLLDTIQKAGGLAKQLFRTPLKSWEKDPGHSVTEADIAVDGLIHTALMTARPQYGWLSEETAEGPERLDSARIWVVDPIDGTRAFMKGRAEFSVSIALVENGTVVLGAVMDPMTGQIFSAQKDRGAFCDRKPTQVSARRDLEGARVLIDPSTLKTKYWQSPWPEMAMTKPNSIALRLAWVAAGHHDAMLTVSAKNCWDIAAGVLLVEEAGGTVGDYAGRKMRVEARKPEIPPMVAGGAALFCDLQPRLAGAVAAWQADKARKHQGSAKNDDQKK
ncbi:MAG: 3'(2'),5'-bisphosphate nucleotidase CysQ [Pseudomonadota bacterium]